MSKLFDYREISSDDLETKFEIGEFNDGDSYRKTKNTPKFEGEKLRFNSPWLYSPFGWGKYNTLVLSSFSRRSFPLDNPSDKKKFRRFLDNVCKKVGSHVSNIDNPDFLSQSVSSPVQYNEQFENFQFKFPISNDFFDNNNNFEGKVFKSTNHEDPEFVPSNIKAIEKGSYVSFVGYIGKIHQSKHAVRYRVIIEQIHWMKCNDAKEEREELSTSTNLFLIYSQSRVEY